MVSTFAKILYRLQPSYFLHHRRKIKLKDRKLTIFEVNREDFEGVVCEFRTDHSLASASLLRKCLAGEVRLVKADLVRLARVICPSIVIKGDECVSLGRYI